eukprot:gene3768-2998_t
MSKQIEVMSTKVSALIVLVEGEDAKLDSMTTTMNEESAVLNRASSHHGHCEINSAGLGCSVDFCTNNQRGWFKQASGPALLLVACCFRKREQTGVGHVTNDFPTASEGTLTDGEVAAIQAKYLDGADAKKLIQQIRHDNAKAYLMPGHELRFGPAAAAAVRFLTKHALIERGFVGVHWRSEQVHKMWGRQNS